MPSEIGEAGQRKSSAIRKGFRIVSVFLLLLFLLSGIVFGLSVSGGLTVISELAGPVLVKLPVVGEPLAALIDSVERPLNAQERRTFELEEMESMLLEREERLREESQKVASARARLEKLQEELERERESESESRGMFERIEEKEALVSLTQGFEEMSSRKAAKIISELSRDRAVEIMKAISQEKMAEILAKMDPATAARMVEALSRE